MKEREQARRRRRQGCSFKEIAREMGRSPGTIHRWTSDIVLPESVRQELAARGGEKTAKQRRASKAERVNAVALESQTADKGSNYNPKGVGEKSEAQVIARLLAADMAVLNPFGDNQRYDLVVDEEGDFIRVQCKTARLHGDYFEFATCSNNWNTKKKRGYEGEADVFAVYLRETRGVYIVPVSGQSRSMRLRLASSGRKGEKMARDYEFLRGISLRDYPRDLPPMKVRGKTGCRNTEP